MEPTYKILLFDLDDTLIDNTENVRYAFQQMLKMKGEIPTEEDFRRRYAIDRQFWRDWQEGKIELPELYKNETGKKNEAFLDWLRAQRVLLYFHHNLSLEEAIKLNTFYVNSLTGVVLPIE
jgi:FMN phosphatase YigB (HAD superfamily)